MVRVIKSNFVLCLPSKLCKASRTVLEGVLARALCPCTRYIGAYMTLGTWVLQTRNARVAVRRRFTAECGLGAARPVVASLCHVVERVESGQICTPAIAVRASCVLTDLISCILAWQREVTLNHVQP